MLEKPFWKKKKNKKPVGLPFPVQFLPIELPWLVCGFHGDISVCCVWGTDREAVWKLFIFFPTK